MADREVWVMEKDGLPVAPFTDRKIAEAIALDKPVVRYVPESAKAEAQPAGTEWVSVEERLPEDAFTRLVFATFRTVAYYEDGSWWRTGGLGAERFEGVTHWMPLPPPPEPRE